MNIKNYLLFAIVLLGSLLVGCTDDFDGFYEFDEYTPSVIMQANQLIESGKIKVSLLDLERAYMSETSKNSKANSKRDFSIEWSDYRVKTEGTVDVVYVPIKLNKKKNQIFTLQTEDGRMKGFSHQFYCTLIMASGKDGKGFEAVMATYLYGGNMKEDDIKRMGRDFEFSGYSGYYITSTLDGTMLSGRYFEDGECKFRFRQNPLPPSERKELVTKTKAMAESDTIRKHDHHGLHIFLNVNPLKRARMTKGSNNDMEWLMTHCSLCGKFYEDCTCVTVEDYPLCQYCHTDIINGRCGKACFFCDLCTKVPYHTHPYYSPEWGGGYTPPSNGGSSTGGGGGGDTGGGGYTGSGGDGGIAGNGPLWEHPTLKSVALPNVVSQFKISGYDRPYVKKICGKCLKGWKEVWRDAGIGEYADCRYAKNFGPFLLQYGFQEIPITWKYSEVPDTSEYIPQIGDTRVWDTHPEQDEPAGHIDWWDGENWVSDYRSADNIWWPGSKYQKYEVHYKIYR